MLFRLPLFFPFLLVLLLHPGASRAADRAMESMLVTASRTPIPGSLAGSSVSVIDAEDLEVRQVVSLSDILRDVPGFAVSRSGGPGAGTQVRVRGAEANQVLVLIDGVEANDIGQGSEFNFAHLLAADVERVEVIRGPQSAMWGSDAMSGVINIITRRGAGPLRMSGFAEGGSFGTGHGGGSIAGGGDRFDFHVGGAFFSTEGSNISRNGAEDDGYENATLTVNAGFEPGDALSIRFTGRHVEAENEYDAIDFIFTGLPVDADNHSEAERNYGRLSGTLSLLEGTWTHTAAVAYAGTDNDNFEGGTEVEGNSGRKYELDYQTSLHLNPGGSGTGHVVTLAVDYEREEFMQRGPVSPFGDPNQDREAEGAGVVAEYRLSYSEHLSISAGLRHDYNSEFLDDTTYRLTGAWNIDATGTRLRAAWGTGSKNPGFTERFGFFATSLTPFVGNASLQPERSEGWEIGADQEFLGGRFRIGATWFDEDLEDEINSFVFDPVLGAFTARNVDGTSRRQGLELYTSTTLLEGLEFDAGYSYLDATQPDATGRQLREVRRPRHSGSVNLRYTFADDRADINLNVQFTGEQIDTFFPPFPDPARNVVLEDYTLAALSASYRFTPRVQIYGRVENLLDDDYEEVFGFRSPGIGAYAGLRVNFSGAPP